MNPIQYVKNLRIWLLFIMITSFVGAAAMIFMLDPTINNLYIFAFLLILLVFLTSFVGILGLWWFFDERRRLLTISQINQIIYQSLITSSVTVCILVMSQTNQLTVVSATIVLGCYILYQLWASSK
jgi:hypothetical protein